MADSTTLADGRPFPGWRPVLRFQRTYHVDARARSASDQNPGTRGRPFRTIGRAAEVLRPGERVLVHPGVYREHIRPARGGTAPDTMISYQAVPGGRVVVRGSEIACGLVFQDGRRLTQAPRRACLADTPGCYWVDTERSRLLVHLWRDRDPRDCRMEITTRQQVFAPERIGLRYIHVKGFVFEHVGNPFPMPQYGAVSTTRGSWWLIEGNTVRQANSIGIDIANQHYSLPQPRLKPQGHIVRRNRVGWCGISGLQGLGASRCLIEDNRFEDNAFHDAERMYESAAIKTHFTHDTLIRGNTVLRTHHGSGIWIDADNRNTRIARNAVVGTVTLFGGIFVEISDRPNLVDHNVVWGTRGSGIYEHATENQHFRNNIVGKSSGPGFRLRGNFEHRPLHGNVFPGGRHVVTDNILWANREGIVSEQPLREVARNHTDRQVSFDRRTLRATVRRKHGKTLRRLAR